MKRAAEIVLTVNAVVREWRGEGGGENEYE